MDVRVHPVNPLEDVRVRKFVIGYSKIFTITTPMSNTITTTTTTCTITTTITTTAMNIYNTTTCQF